MPNNRILGIFITLSLILSISFKEDVSLYAEGKL